MPTFAYYVQDSELKASEGKIEADSYDKAIETLQSRGLYILSLQEQAPKGSAQALGWRFGGGSAQDIIRFSRSLAMLLDAGTPILRALKSLAKQAQSSKMRKALEGVMASVAGGMDLSQAMSRHAVFPRVLCHMVRAGESAGTVSKTLRQFADYLYRQEDIKKKVRSAATYPAVVILFGLALTDFMAVKVVPTFASIFVEFKLKLPPLTMAVMAAAQFAKSRQLELFAAALAAIFAVKAFMRTSEGLLFWARLKRKIPVFHVMFEDMMMEQLFSTLAMLLASGVAVLNSLSMLKDIFKYDPTCEEAIALVMTKVNAGEGVAASFRWTRLLDDQALDAIEVGEEAGSLPQCLESLSKFHGERLDDYARNAVSLLEPFILIFVGCLVGAVMLSLFLPMAELVHIRPM